MSYSVAMNKGAKKIAEKGAFSVYENQKDFSVNYATAAAEYFASKMNLHVRQVMCDVAKSPVVVQAGAMQMMIGDVEAKTDVKGAGDLAKKLFRSSVVKESAIKPMYYGTGSLVLEPTMKYMLLYDVSEWGSGMVIEDGAFLACEASVNLKTVMRKTMSSAVAGNEGLFNLCLEGQGVACLESSVPAEELVEVTLNNDVIKIDGSMAVAWSKDLSFTVEQTTKSLIGSAASGEGLVNVYRGTGKVLIAPRFM